MFLEYAVLVLFFRRGMKVLLFLFFLKISLAAGSDFQTRELYHSDHSIPLDNAEDIIRWYPLAMKGMPLAQFNMGYMYEKGYGVPQNDMKAVKWYRLAANQGLDQAQFHLGRMCERGRGVRQNRKKAIRWYRKAAEQGLIGITMVNAGGAALSVAPFGGIDRRLGTNPISVAVPACDADPIVLDITSSVVAQGKIEVAVNRGDSVPLGWLIDNKGNLTTNPHDFDSSSPGSILPLGGLAGHKGFGLGLIIDVLAGTLSGSGCSGSENARVCNASLMIVIDIAQFIPLEEYRRHIDKLERFMRCSPPAPGFDEILMPGEIESRKKQQRLSEGIPIDDETWRQIQETAANVGISELTF